MTGDGQSAEAGTAGRLERLVDHARGDERGPWERGRGGTGPLGRLADDCRLLANEERLVIAGVVAAERAVAVERLVATLAECFTTPEDDLEIKVRHQHLPKLAEAGVVTVRDGRQVRAGDRLPRLARQVEELLAERAT